jgi:hypothetical protein
VTMDDGKEVWVRGSANEAPGTAWSREVDYAGEELRSGVALGLEGTEDDSRAELVGSGDDAPEPVGLANNFERKVVILEGHVDIRVARHKTGRPDTSGGRLTPSSAHHRVGGTAAAAGALGRDEEGLKERGGVGREVGMG